VYAHPDLRAVLVETHGVIVYHEQVMKTLAVMAGYDLSEADRIRRHLDDDPDHVEALRKDFVARAVRRGVTRPDAERVWKEVASFASFGFCKAHAAAFAVPTFQSAWLKAHYPAHFLAGVLTHEPGMYPRRLILEDARQEGVAILPLDANRSEERYSVEPAPDAPTGWGIRLALQHVDGIAAAEVRAILEARAERPFTGVRDFVRRTAVSKPTAERLAHAGAFDDLAEQRPRAPAPSAAFVAEEREERPQVGPESPPPRPRKRTPTRRDRLFQAMVIDPEREGQQLALPVHGEVETALRGYTDAEKVRAELEVLDMDASRHLMTFFEPLLHDLGVVRSRDLRHHRGNERLMVAGVKVSSQTPAIRSGQRIIFVTLDDATGPVEVTVFDSVQARCAKTVFHSFVLAVVGTLRRTGVAGVSIVAEDVYDLVALHRARKEGRLLEALQAGKQPQPSNAAPKKLWHSSGGSAGW
jgi:error-prone DNA polymerase